MTLQPAMTGTSYSIVGSLKNSDKVTSDTFWLGVWPGLDQVHFEYISNQLKNAIISSIKTHS